MQQQIRSWWDLLYGCPQWLLQHGWYHWIQLRGYFTSPATRRNMVFHTAHEFQHIQCHGWVGLNMFCLRVSKPYQIFCWICIIDNYCLTSSMHGFIRISGLVGYSAWLCQEMQQYGGICLSSISGVIGRPNSLGGLSCFFSAVSSGSEVCTYLMPGRFLWG